MPVNLGTKLISSLRGPCVLALWAVALQCSAAELNGYGVLTSDYVYRGVSYSDSHAAAQLGADVSFDSGLYLGAWASTVDIQNGPTRQRDHQLNYYFGYLFELGSRWTVGVNAVAYSFPGQTGEIDYDYEEIALSVNYRDFLWLEYAWSPDLYHSGRETRNVELLAEWPIFGEVTLGAGGGYYDTSKLTGIGYGYWQIAVSRPFGIIDVDLSFHDTNRSVPFVSAEDRAEQRVSLSARIRF